MASFARVAVNAPSSAGVFVEAADQEHSTGRLGFDYEVPDELRARLLRGCLVIVPFGNRMVQAVVLDLLDHPSVPSVKRIASLVDEEPVLTGAQLSLATWLCPHTLTSIDGVIGLFLPPGVAQLADTLYELAPETGAGTDGPSDGVVISRLLRALQKRGPLRGRQIDRFLGQVEWRRTARSLVRKGRLTSTPVLSPPAIRPKFVRTAQLAAPPEVASAVLDDLGQTPATRRRRRKALEYLIQRLDAVDVAWVYAESGCSLTDLQVLAERELVVLRERQVWRDPLSGPEARRRHDPLPARTVALTEEQRQAWQEIKGHIGSTVSEDGGVPLLLHGVTGSGKTELYLRAAKDVVRAGRQALVLVPEIALTPQVVQRFLVHFPGRVGLIHSRLSDGERYDTWRRSRAGSLQIVIGPRSALFSPLPDVGLVVVDECHDSSFHQTEPPFYDAVAAAEAYARFCGAICILGSATPSVVQEYRSDIGQLTKLQLRQRVAVGPDGVHGVPVNLPEAHIVDMRDELKVGNRSIFSRLLSGELGGVLDRGEQAILYLNRRGSAAHVFCRTCGYVARCPRCETPLTEHLQGGERLLCHRCGYERGRLRTCPECGGVDIRAYGLGTEKVEAEVRAAFPKAKTLRWDFETTRQKDAHDLILHHFSTGAANVLIGTKMLAKGLDFPRVTLVGVVLADVGLFLPDPFAPERVFQLLTQVAGRAGRSDLGGKVILQTFAPDHYVVQAARNHDVEAFHSQELEQRRRLGYPPFTRLLRLEYRHHDGSRAEEEARTLAETLQPRLANASGAGSAVIGPAPCFFSKLDGRYRWQLVLRGANPARYLAGLRLPGWRIEVDPVDLL